jgi:peptidoglycan/xylan/chitin deacetylase (PgdA/CDA1 family)
MQVTLRTVKETVHCIAHAVGLPALGRYRQRDSLLVLTYHSFGPAGEHPYMNRLPIKQFEKQLGHLRRHYRLVSLEEGVEQLLKEAGSGDRPMLAITVDDGYADNYTHLFPVVRGAGVSITVFLATDYLDSGRLPWPTRLSAMLHFATRSSLAEPVPLALTNGAQRLAAGRALRQRLSPMQHAERDDLLATLEDALKPGPHEVLPPLTWQQVREMAREQVRFGAHTHYHGWLDRLDPGEVDEELLRSRKRIEAETAQPCRALAYPNGNWNESVATAARRAGYKLALTQDRGPNRAGELQPLALRRLQVPEDELISTFACRVGGIAL